MAVNYSPSIFWTAQFKAISSPCWGDGRAVAIYEIRTLKSRRGASLVMLAEYPNDVTAIIEAREFLRSGETIEVWREGTLVYRTAPRMR